MGFMECASGDSIWRGYDYYTAKRVNSLQKMNETQYTADVTGSKSEPYKVLINIAHPRTSKCNCPHANGKRIICKHMMAVYFAAFSKEAQRLYDEAIAYQEEEEKRAEELSQKVCQYVRHMKKNELQQALIELLFDGPEWQYDRFIREHDLKK